MPVVGAVSRRVTPVSHPLEDDASAIESTLGLMERFRAGDLRLNSLPSPPPGRLTARPPNPKDGLETVGAQRARGGHPGVRRTPRDGRAAMPSPALLAPSPFCP